MINNGYCIYKKGYCSFKASDSLRTQTKNIPDGYGVYVFHKNEEDGEILYIGKGGTMLQNGDWKVQCLRDRVNNKQRGMRREDFLKGVRTLYRFRKFAN